jgi:hypothetical protein
MLKTLLNIAVEGLALVVRILEVSDSDLCSEIDITKSSTFLWFIFISTKKLLVYLFKLGDDHFLASPVQFLVQ